jgi:hypothetical protein
MESVKEDHGRDQAAASMKNIRKMIDRLEHARRCDDIQCDLPDEEILDGLDVYSKSATEEHREQYHDEDNALQQILEYPLSVQFRSDWHNPDEKPEDAEFEILLTTGGPAVKIVGDLNSDGEPCRAWLEYQDWFVPWKEYFGEMRDSRYLLEFAQELIAR